MTRSSKPAGSSPGSPTGAPSWVIGTAGHVDHGKSTLVRALTGIDPDRLQEEHEREMTIDLGFAWLDLPSGRRVSIIDVPGHERFIKNMLAGVGGIDAALLVIAADEGPMPQTVEHLAILDLLGVEHAVVVLTKTDLVDADWRDLVAEEVRERLLGSTLAGSPIVPVSATSGDGLRELKTAIDQLLNTLPAHAEAGRPRLPVDRVFTISGFGTVVTGTLLDGTLQLGQELVLLPDGRTGRVRGLQSHGQSVEMAHPGARTAVNLTNLTVDDVARGDLLTEPGWLEPTRLFDARLRMVADSPVSLRHGDSVDLFLGAAETPARVALLDQDRLEPGQEGWAQLRFEHSLAPIHGERFIIRRPSPSLTIGGGVVIDPHPPRHRRFRPETIRALEVRAKGDPAELIMQGLGHDPAQLRELEKNSGLPETMFHQTLRELIDRRSIVALQPDADALKPGSYLVSEGTLVDRIDEIGALLDDYHRRFPLRSGMTREEIRQRTGLPARAFDAIVSIAGRDSVLVDEGEMLRRPRHEVRFSAEQQDRVDRFAAAVRAAPHAPPSPAEFDIGAEEAMALAETGRLIRVADGILFDPAAFEAIERRVLEIIGQEGSITLARFRDEFGSSRKYAQAVLEYLDDRRITRRSGDLRVRGIAAGQAERR
ncbi:MAG TPA: selenocysteine-specific translation elongation factor [Thermomicrobiaceae bacterium]|nr:selenocysteine-specific translation elongation factor [Thermomicrobiaceae bacterium]